METTITFKVGDKVQLKSGGPVMTVHSLHDDGRIFCIWFSDKGNDPKSYSFQPETLQIWE